MKLKLKKWIRRLLLALGILLLAVLVFWGVCALYVRVCGIIVVPRSAVREGHTWSEYIEAHSAATYAGYYDANDVYMNEAFRDCEWYGFAYYDVFTATMTVSLVDNSAENIAAVNAYIETIDQGGCTYAFDTCDVPYQSLAATYDRISAISDLLRSLGMASSADLYDDRVMITVENENAVIVLAVTHFLAKDKNSIVYLK